MTSRIVYTMFGYVYKLYDVEMPDMFYVGSSTTSTDDRLLCHRCQVRDDKETLVYAYFRGRGEEVMILEKLEDVEVETTEELRMKEREWYDRLDPPLNMNRPWISEREKQDQKNEETRKWRAANAEHYLALAKKYRDAKPEQVKASFKKYYDNHKEDLNAASRAWYEANKDDPERKAASAARSKKWAQENAEKVKADARRYRAANAERIKAQKAAAYAAKKNKQPTV